MKFFFDQGFLHYQETISVILTNTDLLIPMNQLSEHGCDDGGVSLGSPLAGRLFVLVGAGGAGKALAFGARSRGAHIVIFDIDFGINIKHIMSIMKFNFPLILSHVGTEISLNSHKPSLPHLV